MLIHIVLTNIKVKMCDFHFIFLGKLRHLRLDRHSRQNIRTSRSEIHFFYTQYPIENIP